MVRSYWKGTLVVALTWPTLVWGQQPPQPAPAPASFNEQLVTLQEPGKPEQKCRVLRTWKDQGNLVKEVQDLNTGEVMRVVEGAPVGGGPLLRPAPRSPGMISRVFHLHRDAPSVRSPAAPPNPRPSRAVQAQYQPTASRVVPAAATVNPAAPSGVRQAVLPPNQPAASRVVPVGGNEEIIKIQEPGKPMQHCRVLRSWRTPEGFLAREVQDVASGETMTIVDAGLVPMEAGAAQRQVVASRIFHWGHGRTPPRGAPLAPTVVDAGPCANCTGAIAAGPCATGGCVAASPSSVCGPCAMENGAVATGPCPSCTTTSGPNRIVAMPPGSEPSAVCTAPARGGWFANHVPLWKKWFGRDEVVTETGPGCVQPNAVATASRTPYTTASASASVSKFSRSPTDVAQPTDWRRSWGKPDTAQALADAGKSPPVPAWPKDFDRKPAPTASASAPKASTAPSAEAARTANAKPAELPRAEKRKTDPLTEPERYSKRPEVKNPNAGAVAEATKDVESKYGKRAGDKPATPKATPKEQPKVAKSEAVPAAVGKATTNRKPPLGSRSVLAAYDGHPTGPVCFLPVPMVTLPQRIPPAPPGLATSAEAGKAQTIKEDESQVNAFTPPGYGGGKANGPESPMGNAFTSGAMPDPKAMAYGRPGMRMPPGMGAMPMGMMPPPMSVSPAGYLPPASRPMPAAMPVPIPQATQATPVVPTPRELVSALQNALYPSQRERAARALAACDGKANPEVVDALLLAAREDPAATVRSACIYSLGQMNVRTPGVTTALQGLRDDANPQVRQAANEVLGTDAESKPDASKVQPAGAVAPEAEK